MRQTHIDIQLPETHPGAGDCGRDVHFGESDLWCFEFDQNYLELINIIQNLANMIYVYHDHNFQSITEEEDLVKK